MYLLFRALSFLLSSSLGNRGFQYFPKPKVEKRSNNRAMLTSFLGNFAFRSRIRLSCVISAHFLYILILTVGPGHYRHCASSKIFHQKPHGFPTVFYTPAVLVFSLSLNLLFSLTFTSSILVCQTSSPLLVPGPPPHPDPQMSALSHQPPKFPQPETLVSPTLSAVQTGISLLQFLCPRTILTWALYTLTRALPHCGFNVAQTLFYSLTVHNGYSKPFLFSSSPRLYPPFSRQKQIQKQKQVSCRGSFNSPPSVNLSESFLILMSFSFLHRSPSLRLLLYGFLQDLILSTSSLRSAGSFTLAPVLQPLHNTLKLLLASPISLDSPLTFLLISLPSNTFCLYNSIPNAEGDSKTQIWLCHFYNLKFLSWLPVVSMLKSKFLSFLEKTLNSVSPICLPDPVSLHSPWSTLLLTTANTQGSSYTLMTPTPA